MIEFIKKFIIPQIAIEVTSDQNDQDCYTIKIAESTYYKTPGHAGGNSISSFYSNES